MAEYYEVAAKWWRKRLENKASLGNFRVTESYTPGGGEIMAIMALAMGRRAEEKPEALDAFEKELAKIVKEKSEKCEDFILSTDYGPDCNLYDAARRAKLVSPVFPVKTMMHISKEKVTVSLGYHGKIEVLYPETK